MTIFITPFYSITLQDLMKTKIIIFLYTPLIALILFLGYFFYNFISDYFDEIPASFLTSLLFKGGFIVLSIFLLKKLNLFYFLGIRTPFKITNYTALIIPFTIIGMMIISKIDLYSSINRYYLIFFLFSTLLTGIFEEIAMRGILLPLFIKLFKFNKKSILFSVLISSLIFGLFHYINIITKENYGFDTATSQVIVAFCIGIYFCGLFFRTGNIIPSIIVHSGINFGFGTTSLEKLGDGYIPSVGREINSIIDILPTLILYILIITIGLLMIKFSNKESFIRKLKLHE